MSTPKVTEEVNEKGEKETITKVETVDYRTSAGEEEATKEEVEVVHVSKDQEGDSGGGVVARAVAAVARALPSGGGSETADEQSKK